MPEANLNQSNILRMSTVIFGSLFSNIQIRQYNPDGSVEDELWTVPISYASRQAYDFFVEQVIRMPTGPVPEFGRRFPRMSFDLISLSPSPDKQVMPWTKSMKHTTNGNIFYITSPVAYTFNYELGIYCKDYDSSLQILDQILPYFAPEVSVKFKEQPEMPVINDIKIELQGINKEDNYLEGLSSNRMITWTLNFAMSANYWRPKATPGKSISEIVIDLHEGLENDRRGFFNLPENANPPIINMKEKEDGPEAFE